MPSQLDGGAFASTPADASRVRAWMEAANAVFRRHPGSDAAAQEAAWRDLQTGVLADPSTPFEVHHALFQATYRGRDERVSGPPPAWFPTREDLEESNVARFLGDQGVSDYATLHRWSVENRAAFWEATLGRLKIPFKTPPQAILEPGADVTRPQWLPGARFNIADACFPADAKRAAIVFAREGSRQLACVSYQELERLTNRVARGLAAMGLGPRDRVALYMPMTPQSVAIYLGVIKSGRVVVGIADASAPADVEKRLRIADARAVFTIDAYVRDGKLLRVYEKAKEANAPKCVVLPTEDAVHKTPLRSHDTSWEDFLGGDAPLDSEDRSAQDESNILFSSGTTKDPKAIVWTHATPLKCMMDAHFHHDVQSDDVLAWPTSFGWMMGPWLTFAALSHGATMALYNGSPTSWGFVEFVRDADVTMLGVVPKLVRAWRTANLVQASDWTRIRRFSNTGETSDPEDTLWLMSRAGYRPVIEYCGGTEIGGGYITGTVVQPASPATFTTASLGLDVCVLDENGKPSERGEVGIIPPSIGLSNDLLNYDHAREYYAGFFRGPHGEVLRRHGDQLERLGGGFMRHHGRLDDTINLNGVKTSVEEIRAVIGHHAAAFDTKPIAVDLEGKGQHVLVVYVVPREQGRLGDNELARTLRADFERAIKARLNPLLAHVHDVVLVADLPQAGPGKTRTMKDFLKDYRERRSAQAPTRT